MEKETGKAAEDIMAIGLETIKAANEGREISPERKAEIERISNRSMDVVCRQMKGMVGPDFRLKSGMTFDQMEKQNPNFDRLEVVKEMLPVEAARIEARRVEIEARRVELEGPVNLAQRQVELRKRSDELLQKSRSALKSIEEVDSPEAKARRERIELQNDTWEQYHAQIPEAKAEIAELAQKKIVVDNQRRLLIQMAKAYGLGDALLPPMRCNILGTKGTRVLQWQVAVKGDAEVLRQLTEGVLHHRARAKILDILGALSLDQLDQANAKKRLAGVITDALNELKTEASPELKGKIEEVYFVEFLIQ